MKFLNLKISNFGTYGDQVPAIDFGDLGSVVLIMGKRWDSDMDSNGSGKSLIFEALCWALFNQTSRGTTAEGVIRPAAKTATVEFVFEAGGETYRIVRVRSRTGKKHSCNFDRLDGEQSQSFNGASIDETQQKIQDLIGMDFKAFRNSVMYGQGDESTFVEGTDSERKSVFASLIQMEDLDKCHDEAHGRVREWAEKEEALIREIQWNRDLIERTPTVDKTKIEGEVKGLGLKIKVDKDAIETEIVKEVALVANVEKTIKVADQKQTDREKISETIARLRTLEGSYLDRRRKLLKDIEDAESAPEEIKSLEKEVQEQEAQAKKIKGFEADLKKIEKKVSGFREKLSKAKQDLVEAQARASAKEDTSIEFRRITELGESKCPTCGAEITKDSLGHVKKEIEKLAVEHRSITDEVEKFEGNVEDIDEQLDEVESGGRKIKAEIEKLRGNDKLPLLQSRMGTLKEKQSRLEVLRKDIKDVEEEHVANRGGILKGIPERYLENGNKDEFIDLALEDATKAQEAADEAVDEAREKKEEVTRGIAGVKEKMATKTADLSGLKARLEEAEKAAGIVHTSQVKIDELDKKLANVQVEKADYEILSRAFPEIKTALIEDSIPFLENSINGILNTLTDGVFSVRLVTQVEAKVAKDESGRKKLKEKFEIWISDGQAIREFRTFSGGEKKIIKLALRLALAELSMEFSGKAVHHLLLDEVLGDLDQHKQAQVIDLIRSLSKRFQVLIISHQEIAKEKFDSVLTVARTETSTIEIGTKLVAA